VGVGLAIAAYFGLHSVAGSEVTAVAQPGMMGDFVGQNPVNSLASVPSICCRSFSWWGLPCPLWAIPAPHIASAGDWRPDQGALNHLSGQQFEALVGESFRRKGYSVTEPVAAPMAGWIWR